jgi:NitT/TauT family transport system substrate-binding protein
MPIADAGVLFVAIEKGYLKQKGINPELVSMQGGALIINALGTNDIQVGFSNTMSFILAKKSGIDILSLGGIAYNDSTSIEGAILTLNDNKINSISDLKGKTIAINARANIVELSMKKLLLKNKIELEQVKFMEIPFPQMEPVLRSKQVDAIVIAEPFWTFAEDHGNTKVIGHYFGDVYKKVEITSWFSNQKWLAENPEIANKIKEALKISVDFINKKDNEAEFRRILTKYTKIDSVTAQKMRLPEFQYQLSKEWIETLIFDMKSEKYLPGSFVLNEMNY